MPRRGHQGGQQLAGLVVGRAVGQREERQPLLAGQGLRHIAQRHPARGLARGLDEGAFAAVAQQAPHQHAALVAAGCGPRRQARQLAHQMGRRHVKALLHRLEELERLGRCGWRLHSRQLGAVEAEEAALADERPGRGRARRLERGCRCRLGQGQPGLVRGHEARKRLRRVGQHGQQPVHEVVAVKAQHGGCACHRRGHKALCANPAQDVSCAHGTVPGNSSAPRPPRTAGTPAGGAGRARNRGRTRAAPADCLSPAEGHWPVASGRAARRPGCGAVKVIGCFPRRVCTSPR